MSREAMRLIIEGRVQGVGYRFWAVREAAALGLDGWVRNRRDGKVELLAIGEPGALQHLAESPAHAVRVDRSPAEDDGSERFEERPTV
jgi:acylphosphatase